ncbi:MAG: hypothetical protein UY05_C0003G0006 [Candidatus Peregrinibacteria bacterium GW2011_GWA2_47_7]|nr:MAG: hypothetical protein UY05_C0003G0006 [Candidatus Peregrinibacteria bacterium GW2011_GWA2_47_7]
MSLKPIPVEGEGRIASSKEGNKNKHSNFFSALFWKRKEKHADIRDMKFFTDVCKKFMNFIHKSSSVTTEQIDELIHSLHRVILKLQKEKLNLMKKKFNR